MRKSRSRYERTQRPVRSSRPVRASRKIYSEDEIVDVDIEEDIDDDTYDEGGVSVDESASDLLFEVEDVAELVSEVTGETVEVTAEEDGVVTFAVGDDEYTVEAEGDEEIVESATRVRGKRSVKASRRLPAKRPAKRPVKASSKLPARYTRKISR